jgi:hypothetical protein
MGNKKQRIDFRGVKNNFQTCLASLSAEWHGVAGIIE